VKKEKKLEKLRAAVKLKKKNESSIGSVERVNTKAYFISSKKKGKLVGVRSL